MRALLFLLTLLLAACTSPRGGGGGGGDDDDAADDDDAVDDDDAADDDDVADDDDAADDDDSTAPELVITSPSDGSTLCGEVPVQVTADDVIESVTFELDGDELETDDDAPFQITWDTREVADDEYTLRAIGLTGDGDEVEDAVDLTVDNGGGDCDNPPSITILSPVDGASVNDTVAIDVSAVDDDGVVRVDFFVDSGLLLADEQVPWGATLPTADFAEGEHTLRVVATDTGDQQADDEITVVIDRSGPDVSITSPSHEATVSGVVDVEVDVSDDSPIAEVVLSSNSGVVATLTSSPWTISWDTGSEASGAHTLTVEATDALGNDGSDSIDVDVDQPPTGTWAAPTGTVTSTSVQLSVAVADDLAINSVVFSVDGSHLLTAAVPPWQATWSTCGEASGAHTLSAVVQDSGGQQIELTEVITLAIADGDGDGANACDDCDDSDDTIHPGATELCDGVDNDCSGAVNADEADGDGDGWVECSWVGTDPTIDGGDDCNEGNGGIYPGAPEIANDGIDQDCDGVDWVTVVSAGDLVITEFLKNPSGDDAQREWIELWNATGSAIDLQGFAISDLDTDMHVITDSVVVQPGDWVVLGATDDPLLNGAAPVDYSYGGDISLGNGSDEIELHDPTGQMVDSLYYDDLLWPDPSGGSLNLDPDFRDAASNNFSSNWCRTTAGDFGSTTDDGTPGAQNPDC